LQKVHHGTAADVPHEAKTVRQNLDATVAGLTHDEVLAQSILFLLAGYDTTATTLAFLGYSLAINAECQDKLIAEVDDVMNGQVCMQ
jgi:cytochrome P450